MTVPVFLAEREALYGSRVILDGPEGRHAAAVRRLRPGERADLTDGAGHVAECEVTEAHKDRLELEVRRTLEIPRPEPRITVVQALAKGDRGELAVEVMTEAGVDEIVPWAAARSVARWRGERGTKALERWRRTAREAGKQARRFHLPRISDQAGTDQVVMRIEAADVAIVLHEEADRPLSELELPGAGEIMVVVGPEGGIGPDDLDRFEKTRAVPARLGPTVLRTSTAGLAAAAVLMVRSGRW